MEEQVVPYWLALVAQNEFVCSLVSRLERRCRGQSTVEYALIGALVVVAAAVTLAVLGQQINAVFSSIGNTLQTATRR
jgi:Flp pilus assembly pilin Flp